MENQNRLTDVEAHALLDQLFPLGVAGPDVLAELAPAGWDQSPLLACFHPSAEQAREESTQFHRNLERLRALMSRRSGTERVEVEPSAELTSEATTSEHAPTPVRPTEELTELVGMFLWDVFSDNHEALAAERAAAARDADIARTRTELDEANARAREDAMDRRPPTIVIAYRSRGRPQLMA